MSRFFPVLSLVILAATALSAQRGIAHPGYYPDGYNGDTFRGKVTAVDDKTSTITLLYEHGKKQQSFEGHFDKPCDIPNSGNQPVRASDFPLGTDLTAYFVTGKDAATGQKQDVVIGVTLNTYNGKAIPDTSKGFFPCVGTRPRLAFRAFNNQFPEGPSADRQ